MPTTTGYSFGDIVLVPFPFTDQTAAKKRPAIIVSSGLYLAWCETRERREKAGLAAQKATQTRI